MAGSVNKVILVGNVGKDPEIRSFQSGGRVAKFSLATSENWKDKATGERKEKTEWHNIVIYNDRLIEVVERYIKKGAKLYLEAQLETRKYTDQAGTEKYTTEVVLRQFRGELQMLDSRGGGGGQMSEDSGGQDESGGAVPPMASRSGGSAARAKKSDMDDDIPF